MTKLTPTIYGAAPKDLGELKLDTSEMMFWLYLPIKMPGTVAEQLPKQLDPYTEVIDRVYMDVIKTYGRQRWKDSYVYLSVKVLHVTPDAPGNRPGWHSDGFLTGDLNYIWADRNPTEFFITDRPFKVVEDHKESMQVFHRMATFALPSAGDRREHAKVNHLYRLDQTVIHRVSLNVDSGKRAFVKVSVSDKPYVQLGNSINHLLPEHPRPSLERQAERNCPQGGA
ncbi:MULTISPECIES: hypothetical protein [unclassified Agrobacterium]|uniref:hypothetical protein n=1 Tax=unclassified Agrobacterium TaxID=2632611 RepID=UPI0024494513|nr:MULTISPECIES: hypothetical protein [unclassified Agrobacterium]MDH0613354.1 hypothetical protein [Agrobacterium sp. GD03872]MDH0697271.1 hypothetical protein [Agrobacterium sp. GD03871]MDH1062204.1 hypothetical protein [Agrobacterium sp. GD03992]MDH2211378.1 hypothetical protein [Agrobacterium sp. GD03643]MDH2220637.1 hypothetical protein [Agrobacterium sp. GD03638]